MRILTLILSLSLTGLPGNPSASPIDDKAALAADKSRAHDSDELVKVRYPIGERLVYSGRVTKGIISVDVGQAVLTVTKNADGEACLTASGYGEKFGYTLDTTVSSTIAAGRPRPSHYHYKQAGSEIRERKLEFTDMSATYIRLKHCMKADCKDDAHFVDSYSFPLGSKHVHCFDRHCPNLAHRYWQKRRVLEYGSPHLDVLSAVYYARGLDLRIGAPPVAIPIVNQDDRWIVNVIVTEGGKKTVKAGTFDTLRLLLVPEAAPGTNPEQKFRGLFGLNGTIHVWLDKVTKRPVLAEGILPFAMLDLHARIELTEVGTADAPARAKRPKPQPPVDAEADF